MYLRCFSCKGVTWVDGPEMPDRLTCCACSGALILSKARPNITESFFEDAMRFAEASGIDLPSANSILTGVMTLSEALSIQGQHHVAPSGVSEVDVAAEQALRAVEEKRALRKRASRVKVTS